MEKSREKDLRVDNYRKRSLQVASDCDRKTYLLVQKYCYIIWCSKLSLCNAKTYLYWTLSWMLAWNFFITPVLQFIEFAFVLLVKTDFLLFFLYQLFWYSHSCWAFSFKIFVVVTYNFLSTTNFLHFQGFEQQCHNLCQIFLWSPFINRKNVRPCSLISNFSIIHFNTVYIFISSDWSKFFWLVGYFDKTVDTQKWPLTYCTWVENF